VSTSLRAAGPGSRAGWTLAIASIASFLVALDGLVVTTALGTIHADIDASIAELEWTVNAFTLSFAAMLMTGAALGDRLGRRRVLVAGLGIFTAASIACALAPTAGSLIAARFIQGLGAALITPVALALVSAAFPPEHRGKALGTYSAAIGLGVLCGPVVGGAITQGIDWTWIFWINVPVGIAAIALALSRVEESVGSRGTLDPLGVALVGGASFGVVWGLVRGNDAGWASAEVLAALAAGIALAAAFVLWERRVSHPMLPMKLFRSRAFSAGNGVSFLLFASNLSLTFFLAQFEQVGLGQDPLEAGLRLLPWTGAFFLLAPKAGLLADRLGERPMIIAGMLTQALGLGWLALIASTDLSYAATIVPFVVIGAGTALATPAAQRVVVGAVSPADIGRASGTFSTARWFGCVFGIAVAVAVFAAAGGYGSAQTFVDGFVPALWVSAAFAAVGCLVGVGLPRRDRAGARIAQPSLAAEAGSGR
jgi:EmrB/QacA subfamily drug resistance transporter